MIYKPSNATPSSEEIDVTDTTNTLKTLINTSGEPVTAYKLKLYSQDAKDVLYETSIVNLSTANEVKNKELLKIEVPASTFSGAGITNGNNYLWGVRAYNARSGSTEQPNTLVCDGRLVGSTKYVIWSQISKKDDGTKDEDTLNQIVYDRYIEVEVDKTKVHLSAKPTDEEKLKYKKLPSGNYRERQKITWVEKDLGTNEDYIKIETEDPFAFNYEDGTIYKIFKTSDLHTVTSLFADPNSNINVSDYVIVYNNINEAYEAYSKGDNPTKTYSKIIPALPCKKITGYSSDTGEIRVHDSWTKAPSNGQVYRIFEYDTSAKTYKELFSSDLVQGLGAGSPYYGATVDTGTVYYTRDIVNTSSKTWKYYSDPELSQGETNLPDGVQYTAELVNATYSTIPFKVNTVPAGTKYYNKKYTDLTNALPYYYDKDLKMKAGEWQYSATASELACDFVNETYSTVSVNGYMYYISSDKIKAGELAASSTNCVRTNDIYSILSITVSSVTTEYYVATSNVSTQVTTKYINSLSPTGGTTTAKTNTTLVNSTYSTINVGNKTYNVLTPAGGIVPEGEFYLAESDSITNTYAKITINEESYYCNSSDLLKKYDGAIIQNPYELQLVGGKPIYNDKFVLKTSRWDSTAHKLFILPNINIKTDTTSNGVPDEILINDSDGESGRIDIIKQVDATTNVDITFNKLDDSQWLIEGSALSAHSATFVPQILPQTDYSVYTASMETAPLNMFYARTQPQLTLLCRNTYVKTGGTLPDFGDIKTKDLTGLYSYRIKSGITFYSTIAKVGDTYYNDEECTTSLGTLGSNMTATPYKTFYSYNSTTSAYTISKVVFTVTVNGAIRYVKNLTGGEGKGNTTQSAVEYPVIRTIHNGDPGESSSGTLYAQEFACLLISGVELIIPFMTTTTLGGVIDLFSLIFIHQFTSSESSRVVYTMQNKQGYIWAKTILYSESKLLFYFAPPAYNYRDMEFYTDIAYSSDSEPVHPLIKYYKYWLYDSDGNLIDDSGDVYTTDLTWEFKGLDEGNNENGTSSAMNTYTIKVMIVDEYNREFFQNITFAVYYPIETSIKPIDVVFDCTEQAMQLNMSSPMYALTTDLLDEGTQYYTATYEDITQGTTTKAETKYYIQLNESTKILNYDEVYKDETETFPVEFSDDVSMLTYMRLSSDFMWTLYEKQISGATPEEQRDREEKVLRFGHKHPVMDYSSYTKKVDSSYRPILEFSIDADTFLDKIIEGFEYDNTQDACGIYDLLYENDQWTFSRLVGKAENCLYPAASNKATMLETYGIVLKMVTDYGLHSRDRIEITVTDNTETGGKTYSTYAWFRDGSDGYTYVQLYAFYSSIFEEGVLAELGYSIQNGVYQFLYLSGGWTVSHYQSVLTLKVISEYGLSYNNIDYLTTNDQIDITVSGEEGSKSVTITSRLHYNDTCVISYSEPATGCPFSINGKYTIRFTKIGGVAYCTPQLLYSTASGYSVKTYSDLSNYGINLDFGLASPTSTEEACVCNRDYIAVSLSQGSVTSYSKFFEKASMFGEGSVNGTTLTATMKQLLGIEDVDGLYTIVYNNGNWTFKLEEDYISATVDDMEEYGITLTKGELGDLQDRDYIDVDLTTGEQLELRITNPEYYSISSDGELLCNGYASCFKLYDVTDSDNVYQIKNCFLDPSADDGVYNDEFCIPEVTASGGNTYLLRPKLKLALLPNGENYQIIENDLEYSEIILGSTGPQTGIIYAITSTITTEDQYHTGSLTPGLYQYDPTGTSSFQYGRIIKDPSALYAFITDNSQLPTDNRTETLMAISDFAEDDTYAINTETGNYDFNYSDSRTSSSSETISNLWIDFSETLSRTDLADFDTLWMYIYLTIDNDGTDGNNEEGSHTNPRIKCVIELHEGGMQ